MIHKTTYIRESKNHWYTNSPGYAPYPPFWAWPIVLSEAASNFPEFISLKTVYFHFKGEKFVGISKYPTYTTYLSHPNNIHNILPCYFASNTYKA